MSCASPDRQCPTQPVPAGLAIAVGRRANSPQPAPPGELDAELSKIIDATDGGAPGRGVTILLVDGHRSVAS